MSSVTNFKQGGNLNET